MSLKVQHVATVGGNLCLALPAGAMISLTAALGGSVRRLDPRRRRARGAGRRLRHRRRYDDTRARRGAPRGRRTHRCAVAAHRLPPRLAHPAGPCLCRRDRLRRQHHGHRRDHPPGRARPRRPRRRAGRDRLLVRRPARPRRLARPRHRRAGPRGASGAGADEGQRRARRADPRARPVPAHLPARRRPDSTSRRAATPATAAPARCTSTARRCTPASTRPRGPSTTRSPRSPASAPPRTRTRCSARSSTPPASSAASARPASS